jgi:hypothetical protein
MLWLATLATRDPKSMVLTSQLRPPGCFDNVADNHQKGPNAEGLCVRTRKQETGWGGVRRALLCGN